jgi:predicted house-cleaning noncanonical NTP pyrophosphatase (MazG superfamily)
LSARVLACKVFSKGEKIMPKYERFACHKLVRDLVIPQAHEKGFRCEATTLQGEALRQATFNKLVEEVDEVREVLGNPAELVKELADVMEVVQALAAQSGVSEEDLLAEQQAKRAKRGGFTKGDYLSHFDVPADHADLENLTSQPHKYLPLGKIK